MMGFGGRWLSAVGLAGISLWTEAGGNAFLLPAPEASHCILDGVPVAPQVLHRCQQQAAAGNAQIAYELGQLYYDGRQVPQDLSKAVYWFEQASLKGQAQAQYRLGLMYLRGEGVPESKVQSYIVFKMAAVNGDEEALDAADLVAATLQPDELERATRALGQILRDYLLELQTQEEQPH